MQWKVQNKLLQLFEFEAKTYTSFIAGDFGGSYVQNMDKWQQELLCGNYGLYPNINMNEKFFSKYFSYANEFAANRKQEKFGNQNYYVPTLVKPISFIKILSL